jgi:hypothetical protein
MNNTLAYCIKLVISNIAISSSMVVQHLPHYLWV